MRPSVKGALKSVSFISILTIFLPILFISESTPLRINKLLTASNHSFEKNLLSDLLIVEVDHDVSSKLLSRVGHQQERRYLLAPKRSPNLPVLTPERSDNKFFSRNYLTVPRSVDAERGTFTDDIK